MEFSVKSPANIAFVKYWGQRDTALVLPFNDSFSMNLSNCFTEIHCTITDNPGDQHLEIKEYEASGYHPASERELAVVKRFYDTAKTFLGCSSDFGFRLRSSNTFPKKAGIASSASFFSALTVAFTKAFDVQLDSKQLSVLARLSGSGSACRSIPDGFVWWHKGDTSDSSYAVSVAPPDYWDLHDIVVIVNTGEKKTNSQDGHPGAVTSPYYASRQQTLPVLMEEMKTAFEARDFTKFGTLVEQEAINFHSIMMTQIPPLFYWSDKTVRIFKQIQALRQGGVEAYVTIDAGENLHVIVEGKTLVAVERLLQNNPDVHSVIYNSPAVGARII